MDENAQPVRQTKDGNRWFNFISSCSSLFQSHTWRQSSNSYTNSTPPASANPTTKPYTGNRIRRSRNTRMSFDNSASPSLLRKIIDDGSFWSLPDLKVLEIVKDEFSDELQRLQKATFIRNPNAPRPRGKSISEHLYQQDFAEVNRTLVGVLALRWLHNNQYEEFIGTQSPPAIVLQPDSFAWLRRIFIDFIRSGDDFYTLITSMVTNDLGKDPNLASDYAKKIGQDISQVNHDMILYRAVKVGLVPALNNLSLQNQEDVLLGIKLGSNFNFGQLAQAENAPASLAGLLEMRGHKRAFELRFLEQVLDLSGAAGHEDWTCAKKMIEPIFQSYRNVYDVAHAIISGKMTLRQGYDMILIRKLELLHRAGYKRQFDIHDPTDRALMRLFCIGNTTDTESADVFFVAFRERLSDQTRQKLVGGLNVDGREGCPAVQPTYIPAMLTKAGGNTATGAVEEKVRAITAMLRYLTRCLVVTSEDLVNLPETITVIERDVRKLIPVLDSREFRENPDILDDESIPGNQVANKVSHVGR
ncbi:hypothetical protein B0A52_09774 [Exophiala mesophila]|uniref:Uncharacterized protein n=1 Tax=Exophiala mesophila TaxID=212818 RepID=A0A438MUH2_EXOME|nr:hypothetical protein B0A52_09774 [Exophiala mesophila]